MAHRKSPAVGRLRLTTTVCASGVWIVEMALSEERWGLFLMCSMLCSTAVEVTGSPLENTAPGRRWKVMVELLLDTVQVAAAFGPMAAFPGAVSDWYTLDSTVYEQSLVPVPGSKSLENSLLRSKPHLSTPLGFTFDGWAPAPVAVPATTTTGAATSIAVAAATSRRRAPADRRCFELM